ncbi:hypothetical protein KVR01_007132 [Diaporthe batatas]|uniref:uncharacterized protein n=1 Tax=Diaporthe batatas TaxID=748121 RepID=UPI001D04CCB6|nr:uncharacterized protein KVR01_007132 [Diaporthe batatas]KAG8162654.1 hypothetical protein KVR01_007132 [Diaporthe batatas]
MFAGKKHGLPFGTYIRLEVRVCLGGREHIVQVEFCSPTQAEPEQSYPLPTLKYGAEPQSIMTTKPSNAPWADEPFRLIPTPSNRPELENEKHSYVHVSSEMAHVHNVLIRGLNSIVQQAPYVKAPKDCRDLLSYVASWVKMVEHHHDTEESFIFPEVEKFAGTTGLMDAPKHQHELFHDGLERLLKYAQSTQPERYKWEGRGGMKEIVDSFSKELMDHLYAEVDLFLSLKDLDSAGLRKTWDQGEAIAARQTNFGLLTTVFPCVLGNADKTYEGGHEFPPLPRVLPYIVKYALGAGNGAWRFNSCDFFGRPRPLAFGPDQKE